MYINGGHPQHLIRLWADPNFMNEKYNNTESEQVKA
jgi:hypothetical protein